LLLLCEWLSGTVRQPFFDEGMPKNFDGFSIISS
jgi:hypothetical protein